MPRISVQPRSSPSIALSLPREAQWVPHHVLLDSIERDIAAADSASGDPPSELYRAFEALDRGVTNFTAAELEDMQNVLAEYQRATDEWEFERSEIERLLRDVSTALEAPRPPASS